jgi:putative peptide zinc metalloprotease protein
VAEQPVRDDARLTLHELVVRSEDGGYVVGRPATGTFVTLPAIGARAIELLRQDRCLRDVRAQLQRAHAVDVDVRGFAGDLIQLGFVRAVDGEPLAGAEPPHAHLARLRERHVRWTFSVPTATLFALIVAAAIVTVIRQPGVVPHRDDFFWLPTLSLTLIANTAIFALTATVHELAHLAAARSLGVPRASG